MGICWLLAPPALKTIETVMPIALAEDEHLPLRAYRHTAPEDQPLGGQTERQPESQDTLLDASCGSGLFSRRGRCVQKVLAALA